MLHFTLLQYTERQTSLKINLDCIALSQKEICFNRKYSKRLLALKCSVVTLTSLNLLPKSFSCWCLTGCVFDYFTILWFKCASNKTRRGPCPKYDRRASICCLAGQNNHFQIKSNRCVLAAIIVFHQPNRSSMLFSFFFLVTGEFIGFPYQRLQGWSSGGRIKDLRGHFRKIFFAPKFVNPP